MRSVKRGICPIAPLTLHLTLYSLTGSRIWPLGSRDVISHVTIGTADGPFLLVISWCQVTISHGRWDIEPQTFRGHDLDPFGSHDVIGHMTIGPQMVVSYCPYLARLPRYWVSKVSGSRVWPFRVKWCHQSCDHWNRRWSFPVGHPLTLLSLSHTVAEILSVIIWITILPL